MTGTGIRSAVIAFLVAAGGLLPSARGQDCNTNGVDDATDIALGTSLDCNSNGVADECELNTSAPIAPRFLFDASKAEMAGNADWIIDADVRNIGNNGGLMTPGFGSDSNPQQIPTPAASGITAGTAETYWSGGISAWGVELVKQGMEVESLPYNGQITFNDPTNAQDLSNYTVFVGCEPNIAYTAAEKTAILNFVQAGGGLFMVANHINSDRNNDGVDSPEIWNDLMQNNGMVVNPFGILFNLDNISPNSTSVDTDPTNPLINGPFGSVSQLIFFGGSSITIDPVANPAVGGAVWTSALQTNSNLMAAFSTFGQGRVAAMGDSSPADDGTGDPNDNLFFGWTDAGGSHARLIINASLYLACGSVDCNSNGIGDLCELVANDCNTNGVPDECDISDSTSTDCNTNGVPDECESPADCNSNGVQDFCDLATGTSSDANSNGVPDECETVAAARAALPGQQVDIVGAVISSTTDLVSAPNVKSFHIQDTTGGLHIFGVNATIDPLLALAGEGDAISISGSNTRFRGLTELVAPLSLSNQGFAGVPASAVVSVADFQNASPTAEGLESTLVSLKGVTFQQAGSFAGLTNYTVTDGSMTAAVRIATNSLDLIGQPIPTDTINITGIFSQFDSVDDGIDNLDGYQLLPRNIADITSIVDCNTNGIDDGLDIAGGTSDDCNSNAVPDECESSPADCNTNGILDECDIAGGTSTDCNSNGILDECDIASSNFEDVSPLLPLGGSHTIVAPPDATSTVVVHVILPNTGPGAVTLSINGTAVASAPFVVPVCFPQQAILEVSAEVFNSLTDPSVSDGNAQMTYLISGGGGCGGGALSATTSYSTGDCNGNGIPDECDPDTDTDGLSDECDPCAGGAASGDSDANGSRDLDDYADFEPCLNGVNGGLGTGCECFDFDSDNDVDLKNYAEFQVLNTGP